MNPRWREFLRSLGALPDTAGVVDFPSRAADPSAARLSDLAHLSLVDITGADAASFLHSQLTSDIAGLPVRHARPGAWCTAKGRVIAVLIVMRLDGRHTLVLPREQCATVVARLRTYVLRADVRIVERDADAVAFGLVAGSGCDAPWMADLGVPPPWGIAETAGCAHLRLPDAADARRWLIVAETDAARSRWTTLAAGAAPAARSHWRLQDVLAGLPWLSPGLAEEFLPQELGLESLGALSLSKGCYPGQEVIARVHFRGRAKRGLFPFTGRSAAPPVPGTALVIGGAAPRPIGTVLDAQPVAGGTHAGLAVCAIDTVTSATPGVSTADGAPIALGKLIR